MIQQVTFMTKTINKMEKTNLTIDEIDAEIDKLQEIVQEKDSKWDHDKPFDEYREHIEPEMAQMRNLSKIRRMIMPYELSELPDYGDVMSLQDFIENCKCGNFIDYDGYGYYVKNAQETNIMIIPSDVEHGAIRPDFDTIIWYNR